MSDPADIWATVNAAREDIARSPGALLHDELGGVARSYRLFQGNAREFERFLAYFDGNEDARLKLWDVRNRKGFDAFLDEVDRLLHNYLAAATTLRDHTRRLWQQHPPPDPVLQAEYSARAKETFTESPFAQFVQRLRNYSMHSKLPLARGRFTWSREEGDHSTVVLPKSKLLEWQDWNATAQEFIGSCDEEIDLRAVVRDYTAIVDGFNRWFGRAFVGGHLPAFDDLNARIAKFNDILERSGLRLPVEMREDSP